MSKISKCPCCGSERLLEGKMDASFLVPDPVFRFTFDDSPSVGLFYDLGLRLGYRKGESTAVAENGGEMDAR